MLKRGLAILLLFALISTNFSQLLVYAGFRVNQKYISNKLCENKNRPWMHCNGKCYLMKKIRQVEENEQKQEVKDYSSRLDISLVTEPLKFDYNLKTRALPKATLPLMPDARYQECFHSRIFQPPRASWRDPSYLYYYNDTCLVRCRESIYSK